MASLTFAQNDSLKRLLETGLKTLINNSIRAGAKSGTATVGAIIGTTLFIMNNYFDHRGYYPSNEKLTGTTIKQVERISDRMYTFPDAGSHEDLCDNVKISETTFQILASISCPEFYKNSKISVAAVKAMKEVR